MASIFSGILTFQKITAFLEIIFFLVTFILFTEVVTMDDALTQVILHDHADAKCTISRQYRHSPQIIRPSVRQPMWNLWMHGRHIIRSPGKSCSKQTVQPSRSDSTFSFPESLILVDLGIKASLCKLQMAIFASAGGSEPLCNEKSYSMNSSDALILEASKFLTSAGRLSASVK